MTNDIDKKVRKLYKKIEKLEDMKALQKKEEHIQLLEIRIDQYKAFYNITKTLVSPGQWAGIFEKLRIAGYNLPEG
jgi:SMC interacting uncharacterized protein involved in chromosome segregation